jgi:uncharacterized protein with ParB-like and HNH nuclease domain
MENRVYYGQYSLKHWLELILKKNILLPPYQRYFVWDENRVKTLIETFKQKQFVPPITIGAFKVDEQSNSNLILDGQQRLTSILLAYLDLYPDKTVYKLAAEKLAAEKLADENDDDIDDDLDNILEWNFSKLTEKGQKRNDILSGIIKGNYKITDYGVNETFFKENFLGFSYLVPYTINARTQQRYYSSVFRNINAQGQALLAQESRASLYFLNEGLADFFNPDLIKGFVVKNLSSESKTDFVRFLSLLTQYAKEGNSNKVARGFKPKMEIYYEDYIYSVVGEKESQLFKNFSNIFPDGDYKSRFEKLKIAIQQLEIQNQFSSIIDLDVYFFGLIYAIVFENESIDVSEKVAIREELDAKIAEFKANEGHKKAPGALKYLKERITSSIEIYNRYINE